MIRIMEEKAIPTRVLMHLCGLTMLGFFSRSERFEARVAPGLYLILTGEPVTDLNYIVVATDSADIVPTFESYLTVCDERDLPFAAMFDPEVDESLLLAAERSGLVHAGAWPLMLCPAHGVQGYPRPGVEVLPLESAADAEGVAAALAGAFSMPINSARRTRPLEICRMPGFEIYVAREDGRVVSTVSVTRHDRLVGIWAMGTLPEAQGKGAGKALLSQVMLEHCGRGAEAFFLGATPSGKPLYERLGYRGVAEAQVWVRGESHQV
jgi:GNAT superfamily N-acetyltransferase